MAKRKKSKNIAKYVKDFYTDLLYAYELFQAGKTLYMRSKLDSDKKSGEALMIYANGLLENLERKVIYTEVAFKTANIAELTYSGFDRFDYHAPSSLESLSIYIQETDISSEGELGELNEFERRLKSETA